jgi:hypothetical protein
MSDFDDPKEPALDYVEIPEDSFWNGVAAGIAITIILIMCGYFIFGCSVTIN